MNSKKYIRVLLSTLLILTVLVSCGYEASAGEVGGGWADNGGEIDENDTISNEEDFSNNETPSTDVIEKNDNVKAEDDTSADFETSMDKDNIDKPSADVIKSDPLGSTEEKTETSAKADEKKDIKAKKDVKAEGKSSNSPYATDTLTIDNTFVTDWKAANPVGGVVTPHPVAKNIEKIEVTYSTTVSPSIVLDLGDVTGKEIALTYISGSKIYIQSAANKTLVVENKAILDKFIFDNTSINVTLKTSGIYIAIVGLPNPNFIATDKLTLNAHTAGSIELNDKELVLGVTTTNTFKTTGYGTITPAVAGLIVNIDGTALTEGTVNITGTNAVTVNTTNKDAKVVFTDNLFKLYSVKGIAETKLDATGKFAITANGEISVDTKGIAGKTDITPTATGKIVNLTGKADILTASAVKVNTITKDSEIVFKGFSDYSVKGMTNTSHDGTGKFAITANGEVSVDTKGIAGKTDITLGTADGNTITVKNTGGTTSNEISITGNAKTNTVDLSGYTGKVSLVDITTTTIKAKSLTINNGNLKGLNLETSETTTPLPPFIITLEGVSATAGMSITSENIKTLTIKGLAGTDTFTGTSDVSGMKVLESLNINNAIGKQTITPPKSVAPRGSGTASPFTNLTINSIGVTDVRIDTGNTVNAVTNTVETNSVDIIPDFKELKITGVVTGLTKIDISNCGIESTTLPITVTATTPSLEVDISGNGFHGTGNFDLTSIVNMKKLIFQNNPDKYTSWVGGISRESTLDIKTKDKLGATKLEEVDLSYTTTTTPPAPANTSTHAVKTITYDTKENLNGTVETKSHSALTINILKDATTIHTITGDSSIINLENNSYTSWPDGRFKNSGKIGSTFTMKNYDTATDVATTSINLNGLSLKTNENETGMAPTIVFESAFTNAPDPFVHVIANKTVSLTFGDKSGSPSTKYTIQGPGTAHSDPLIRLKDVTLTHGSVGIIELTYDNLLISALPKLTDWNYSTTGNKTDKKLTLNNNGLENLGKFNGNDGASGQYHSVKGYKNLNIVEILATNTAGNPIKYLNLSDQHYTLHTLNFKDKAALVTYNLKKCKLLVNGSTATTNDALAEVFNVHGTPSLNGVLQKVDYSGCTQLGITSTNSIVGATPLDKLELHSNAIDTAYLGNIENIININLYDNKLAKADAVTKLPNSDTGSEAIPTSPGLYFGDTGTNFHEKDKTLDISGNILDLVKLSPRFINVDEGYNNNIAPRNLGMKNLYISNNKNNTIIEKGVFVSDELNLTDVHLGDSTVKTQLNLSHNPELKNLWGTKNTHTGAVAPIPGGGGVNSKFNLKGILDLTDSKALYGQTSTTSEKFIEFNKDGDNEHRITHAFLDGMSVENVQINNNETLVRISLRDPNPSGTIIKNLELSNNKLTVVDSTIGDVINSSVVLPRAEQLEGIIRLDTNPISKVNIIDYGKLTFVSLNNSAITPIPNMTNDKNKLPVGSIKNVISGGVTITNVNNTSTLVAVDIHSNEVHDLKLNDNPVLESIFGTLSVDPATSIGLYTGIVKTIFTYPLTGAKSPETSMIVGDLNLSKTAKIPTEIIFRGHLIKEANLYEASFDKIDLRRNNGYGETESAESPLYMVDLKDESIKKHGVLKTVNISKNTGKPILHIYLDENLLKKIDSSKNTDTDMVMENVIFETGAVLTVNKNSLTDVTIIKSANNNADNLVEVQLNDNELKNINFTNMEKLTTLLVNRTIEGKNQFNDGSVILNNTNKLKMFAPVTLVQKDKVLDDKVSRRKPNRPNEYRWKVEKTVNDNGLSFTLDYVPEDAFTNITVPTPAKFNTATNTTIPEAGFYTYVPISKLDVKKAANLLTLRVPGNHLTDGTMALDASAAELKFIDISGSHNLTKIDGEYAFPGTGKIQDDYFYEKRSGSLISPAGAYKDPNSGKLGVGKSFVSVWPKAEHIYFYNNQYTSFDIGSSANSAITVLAHNNHMTHVKVDTGAKLQVLDVERNIISPSIILPKNLLIIRAGYNLISVYPNTPAVPTLQEIYLNHNNFPERTQVAPIKSNPNLKVLNVSVNNFWFLPELEGNPKLEELYAYRNHLETLPKLAPSGSMKVLDLNHNLLVQIIYALPESVRYLDVSDNLFKDLDLPNIPAGMASKDNIVIAHEVRPSHMDDTAPGLVNPPVGYEGTLNIRHNQIPTLEKPYHDAWVAYFNNSPTKIGHFYLEYNLLDIDVYDPNNRDYMTGTQKWMSASKSDFIFIVTATYTDRHATVVPYLAFYHPGRKTFEKAPAYHEYDIWFPDEIDRDTKLMDILKTIHTNINTPMYARIAGTGYMPGKGSKNLSTYDDLSLITSSDAIKEYSYTFRGFTFNSEDRDKTPRNNIAAMAAKLYTDTSYASEFGDKVDSKKDGKGITDGTKKGGKYNPTTGPR